MNLKGGRGIYPQFLLNYKEIVMARGYLAQVQKLIDEKFKDNPDGLKQKLKEIEEAKKAQLTGELIKKIEECHFEDICIHKVKDLIKQGADIKVKDSSKNTILHIASYFGDIELAKECLQAGIDVNSKDSSGDSPLYWAVYRKNQNTTELTELLISAGADVNAMNSSGETPLFWVSYESIAELLISSGANVDVKDDDGNTPLHGIVCRDDVFLAEYLISAGVEANTNNKKGHSPLDWANSEEMKSLLKKHGAK